MAVGTVSSRNGTHGYWIEMEITGESYQGIDCRMTKRQCEHTLRRIIRTAQAELDKLEKPSQLKGGEAK